MDRDFEDCLNELLLTCNPENVVERIKSRWPDADILINDSAHLPTLTVDEVWCCWCGCGEIAPVKVVMYTMYAVDKNGSLSDIILETYWASPHTRNGGHEGLFVWDNRTDSKVDGKYLYGTC